MAYAAVISLKQTINGIINSYNFPSPPQILEFAYEQTTSLQQVLEKSNGSSRSSSKRLHALERQIRDCAHKLEDAVEFHELNSSRDDHNFEDYEEVRQEITYFAETVKKMEKDYMEELSRDEDEDDDDDGADIDFCVEMVGRSSLFTATREHLLNRMRPDDMCFFSLCGESGSGRTVAAKIVFDELCNGFDCSAWVTVGTKLHQMKQVLMSIIAQVDGDINDISAASASDLISSEHDETIILKYLYKILEHRRYMIVLDDVHDVQVVECLRKALPDQSNGSIVFLTTSLEEIDKLGDINYYSNERDLRYYVERIWFSFRMALFGTKSISRELEDAGKKILENCRGRYISAAKTFLFLQESEPTLQHWSKTAEDRENPIFMVADEIQELSKIETEMQSNNWDVNDRRRKLMDSFTSHIRLHCEITESIKMQMHPKRFFSKMEILSLFGMAGIGKSIFARKLLKDESISRHFDHHVLVTLGQKYKAGEILVDILTQIYPDIDRMRMKADEKLVMDLCAQLSCKRCLILLDDVWSKEPLHHLKSLFPDIKGIVLVTTRLSQVAKYGVGDYAKEIKLLDKEESWSLLRQEVFAGEHGPFGALERAGRKIAEKCEGLPLFILIIAGQLLKVERDPEYWNDIALGKEESIFKNAHNQISKILLPSYNFLPHHLKACFLYLGVFHEKLEIPTSNVTNMWIAEGFIESNSSQNVEDYAAKCLIELDDNSLVIVERKAYDFEMKTCRLHLVFWHLCNSEANKNRFYHTMNSRNNCSIESMKNQRILCIRNSILLSMKDVQNSIASTKSAHSFLCVTPIHQYPVPINFELRLLRVMNALTIRLYEFPLEVVRLIHLRYLALTCEGELPTSISNLWKLQYLMVKQYLNIKSYEDAQLLPVEIWDMKELKHLQVTGARLPDPKYGSGLLNLSTLLDVSAQSCTKEVLEQIPNLKRLGIQIELEPDDEGNSFNYLNNIGHHCALESLKCVVVNPEIESKAVPPPPPISMFPASLKKLSLSGLGYPWMYMFMIGRLKNLEVLKLKHYAFQGQKWDMSYTNGFFSKLKFLSIEDTNLVDWKNDPLVAMNLERLRIKHCYELEECPTLFSNRYFKRVEIVDCNPLAVTWAKRIDETVAGFQAQVQLSWIGNTHATG